MSNSAKVLRFKSAEVPRQQGEVGRLRVLKGPDQGLVYIIRNSSILVGRGDESDAIIGDLKASRKHFKLEFGTAGWTVTDLGSGNGILFQGEYIRKFPLMSGQHFMVGETVFEFLAGEEQTRVLMAPIKSGDTIIQSNQNMAAQRLRVQALSEPVKIAAPKQKKSNRTILLIAILAGAYFYFEEMDQQPGSKKGPPKKSQKKEIEEAIDKSLESYLAPESSSDISRTAEQYYRAGFREYREGNYMRAKSQFELALQVNPAHQLARKFLMSADKEIENEVKNMINIAQKAMIAGRKREARGHYETAKRLLYYDRSNPDFIECEEEIKKIDEELKRGR
jgi:pSer/pThr/pTyr-binding forkhead associated (FHA) protein